MTNTIRVIYKNDEGEQYTVNAPLLKEKDVQLVFKSVNIQIDDTILFDNYYYSYFQHNIPDSHSYSHRADTKMELVHSSTNTY